MPDYYIAAGVRRALAARELGWPDGSIRECAADERACQMTEEVEMTPPPDFQRRLMYILFRALHDARSLALGGRGEQVADLADAVENLPSQLNNWRDDSLEAIRFQLRTYEDKYFGAARYSQYLEAVPVPDLY
jgi:hypothetical protein